MAPYLPTEIPPQATAVQQVFGTLSDARALAEAIEILANDLVGMMPPQPTAGNGKPAEQPMGALNELAWAAGQASQDIRLALDAIGRIRNAVR